MPDGLLDRLDAQARAGHETRSGLLQRLVERELETSDRQMREEVEQLLDRIGPLELGGDAARLVREDRESH